VKRKLTCDIRPVQTGYVVKPPVSAIDAANSINYMTAALYSPAGGLAFSGKRCGTHIKVLLQQAFAALPHFCEKLRNFTFAMAAIR
jgi:hypothetical protein